MSDEKKILSDVIASCWRDQNFKQRFMADPKAVLAERGVELEKNTDFRVVEDTDKVVHFVLPAAPPKGELSDDELRAVAGGTNIDLTKFKGVVKKTTQEPPH